MTIKLFVFFMKEETGEEHFRKSNHIIQLILYEQLALYGMKVLSHAVVFFLLFVHTIVTFKAGFPQSTLMGFFFEKA